MYTNRLNLPQAIVNAVTNDPYSSGGADISCTRLIAPPQQVYLQKQYADKIVEDVADRIFSLLGQAVHTILERAAGDGDIVEERYFGTFNGWKVSGQADLISHDHQHSKDCLYDFKITSSWVVLDGVKPEWEQQLNVLHYLADDPEIERLAIVAILRDWSKLHVMRSPDYPRQQVVELEVPLWDRKAQEDYIIERVRLHQKAQFEHEYPECTPEERWAKDDVFAVMKEKRKSAVKLHDTKEAAEEHLNTLDDKHYIQFRKGESVRCQSYCNVKEFCPQASEANT